MTRICTEISDFDDGVDGCDFADCHGGTLGPLGEVDGEGRSVIYELSLISANHPIYREPASPGTETMG